MRCLSEVPVLALGEARLVVMNLEGITGDGKMASRSKS